MAGGGGTVADGAICLAANSGEPQHDGSDPVRDLSVGSFMGLVHLLNKLYGV
jgi:hypothetical protein